jgi:hypothetical protein
MTQFVERMTKLTIIGALYKLQRAKKEFKWHIGVLAQILPKLINAAKKNVPRLENTIAQCVRQMEIRIDLNVK